MTTPPDQRSLRLQPASPLAATLPTTLARFHAERAESADEDVHMVAAVVDHVVEHCTEPGDLVVDPFAGFGTTLARAAALGRRAFGIELLPERVEHVRRTVPPAIVVEGDARELLRLARATDRTVADGAAQLVLTSPPYMTANDHEADPLTAYERDGGDYERYLAELGLVAAQCARLTAPGGYVVWNVADISHNGHTTRLISDCTRVLASHLEFVGRTEIVWDVHPHDIVADALLVFSRPGTPASA
ncbi:DNA methyltransferase [Leucobacter aridicollis]|uniref:DNA methyltransferase n=1 Tax=Leucobacter aridicollis TaxID=283878 RepID=UPI000E64EE1F|nr:DNA methyltransferase [Leucobacter aridicollis]UTX51905.1 site-specific DNA-methyltransferase [Leucobacter aridicollis]